MQKSCQKTRMYQEDFFRWIYLLCNALIFLPTTVGSRSIKTALGTCFPAPVSLKNVLNESSPPPTDLSLGIWPSGWIPCSKQYSSQHALPHCTPAWPTWIEMHSLCRKNNLSVLKFSFYDSKNVFDCCFIVSKTVKIHRGYLKVDKLYDDVVLRWYRWHGKHS